MHSIICIVGKSGTGKTSVAEHLEKYYDLKSIQSYTTRPKRYKGETGHIFISDKEYKTNFARTNKIAAYNYFNGYHYFATIDQLEKCDIYIVDFAGIKYLVDNPLLKHVVFNVIYLDCPWWIRAKRMLNRGDTLISVIKRLLNDRKEFSKEDIKEYSTAVFDTNKITTERLAWDIYKLR